MVEGGGFCRFFTAGGKFKIKRHDATHEREKSWVCASVHHLATDMTHLPNEREATSYSNTFVCVPDNTVLRSQRKTPRPYIRGPQYAVVTGAAGEEIERCERSNHRLTKLSGPGDIRINPARGVILRTRSACKSCASPKVALSP